MFFYSFKTDKPGVLGLFGVLCCSCFCLKLKHKQTLRPCTGMTMLFVFISKVQKRMADHSPLRKFSLFCLKWLGRKIKDDPSVRSYVVFIYLVIYFYHNMLLEIHCQKKKKNSKNLDVSNMVQNKTRISKCLFISFLDHLTEGPVNTQIIRQSVPDLLLSTNTF